MSADQEWQTRFSTEIGQKLKAPTIVSDDEGRK